MSQQWDDQYKNGQGRFWPNEELVRFLGRTYGPMPQKKASGLTAIEIGSGVGGNVWALSQWGFFTYGLELSAEAIKIGMEHAKRNGFEHYKEYRQYKAPGTVHLPAKSASLAVDVQTMQHLTDEEHLTMYAEVHRLLAHGGHFFSVHWCGSVEAAETIFPAHPELSQWKQALFEVPVMLMNQDFRVSYCETVERTYAHAKDPARWLVVEAVKP
jgi:SAM-dependent methyltransferase